MAELVTQDLFQTTDVSSLLQVSTAEVAPLQSSIAQERALDAISFSIGINFDGYNLYALGSPKTDKRKTITSAIKAASTSAERPSDFCYLENFDDPGQPLLIELPNSWGVAFRKHMQEFINNTQIMVPAAFESEEYRQEMQGFAQNFHKTQTQDALELENEALELNLAMLPTPNGFVFAPISDGKVMEHEDFLKLPEEERQKYQQSISTMTQKLVERLRDYPSHQQTLLQEQRKLRRDTAQKVIAQQLETLRQRHKEHYAVMVYLDRCELEILDNLDKLQSTGADNSFNPFTGMQSPDNFFKRFEVNLLVDSSDQQGIPVIYESNPSLENLVGKLEHRIEYGNLVTDFSQIRAGALHRANGGYLVLDAERVLQKPFAWEALKRALNDHRVRIESVSQLLNMTYSVSLEPEAMPLNVKVVLLGSRELYHLLRHYDSDFGELFKVVADFADHVERTDANIAAYVSLIATIVKDAGISHLDPSAVARVLEYCSREVEDRTYLSTHVSEIRDLLLEADFLAKKTPEHLITSEDVTQALNKRTHRLDRFREIIQDNISRGVIRVETSGTQIGQINGLAIVNIGQINFGQPTRITATTRLGRGQVVDIERESNLGGDIHSKAVLIVSSYIGARYARNFPLSLSASLVFEQSYAGIDGDSASIAEVCALISAIAQLPIKQSIAITGSMDQHGKAQAIGGVNQKIEGFFRVCKQQGLDGSHGVIIPVANKHHLMLDAEVIDAVEQGQFHIYAINNVDEALEIVLTKDGESMSPDDLDAVVTNQLQEFNRIAQQTRSKEDVDGTEKPHDQ